MFIKDLVGRNLNDFKLVGMTEVFRVNEDNKKTDSLGFFKDEIIAKAYAGLQKDAHYHETASAYVLTDGVVGYVVTQQESVKLFDDEAEVLAMQKAILEKLSIAECTVLGFNKPTGSKAPVLRRPKTRK